MSLYWISALRDGSAALASCKTCSGRLQSAQLGRKGLQKKRRGGKQIQQSELLYSASEEQRDGQKVALAHCVKQYWNNRNWKHSQWRSNEPQKGNLIFNTSKVEDKVNAQTSLLREAANSNSSELTNNNTSRSCVCGGPGQMVCGSTPTNKIQLVAGEGLFWCKLPRCPWAKNPYTLWASVKGYSDCVHTHTYITHIHTNVDPRWLFVMNTE